MARYGYGMSVSGSRTAVVASSGGGVITTSRAFNSSGVQVGDTITGDIPNSWVDGQTTVTSVTFANDNSVTSIGNYAFQSCTSLTSITIPNSVTSLGSYAFGQCSALTTATIGNSVTIIGFGSFKNCTSLSSITIPNSVTSIESYAFYFCTSLTSITIPNSVTSIENYAFRSSGLTSITFTATSSVTSIGDYAFASTSLDSITIPNNVQSIGSNAFSYCTALTTATIGTGVTSIGDYAFRESTNLATVLCRVAQSAFTGSNAFYLTASPLVIQARITDASWTAGTGLTFQGNTNVTVIKNL